MGFAGQIKLGLEANTKLDLVGQYEFGLGGPVQNWAWWARENWLGGQYETGLGRPVQNWVWWPVRNWA